jgi:hypothetical protein
MLRFLLAFSIFITCPVLLAGDPIFEISDPRNDDKGAGTLTYPIGIEWDYGDLDLIRFSAEAERDGVWFEARFRNRVRSPEGLTIKTAAEPIKNFVKYDFFNINIDIYIDKDGKPGSGNVSTVPGRQVEVARDSAWEKAVVLTPRPFPARSLLEKYMENQREAQVQADRGRISKEESEAIEDQVKELVADRFFFPTRIRVSGRDIRFFVPKDFLGDMPQPDWRYTVLITAADIEQRLDLSFLDQGKATLFMVPVLQATAMHSWGVEYGSDTNQPPVADILLPTVELQQQYLSDYDSVSGRMATIRGFSIQEFKDYKAKPAAVAGASTKPTPKPEAKPKTATPKPKVAETKPTSKPNTRHLAKPVEKPADKPVVKATSPTPGLSDSVGVQDKVTIKVKDPEPKTEVKPSEKSVDEFLAPAPGANKGTQQRGIAERLRELDTLKKEGLISEEEYQRLRKRILSDL